MPMARMTGRRHRGGGFTLLEVLVAVVVMLAGVVGIIQLFPASLQAQHEAELRTAAALLGKQKVHEIRRDADLGNSLVRVAMANGGETERIVWSEDERLAYSFSSEAVFEDPVFGGLGPGEAWVIVRTAASFDPGEKVLFQARLDR